MQIKILIKKIREGKGLSLEDLSKLSGVSKTHINDIERNLKTPTLPVMVQLSIALKVSITELYEVIY